MIEKTVVVGAFQCNCRIFACKTTGDTIIFDPGDEPHKIKQALEQIATEIRLPLVVRGLFHTHGHLDHINATTPLKEAFPQAIVAAHPGDAELFKNLALQGQIFGLETTDAPIIDRQLEDEEVLTFGALRVACIHTPGHSPGGVCFRLNDRVLTGDTLFAGSIGRSDLWGGDGELLIKSIERRLLVLDGDLPILPGHGPNSTIDIEKRTNPFL